MVRAMYILLCRGDVLGQAMIPDHLLNRLRAFPALGLHATGRIDVVRFGMATADGFPNRFVANGVTDTNIHAVSPNSCSMYQS